MSAMRRKRISPLPDSLPAMLRTRPQRWRVATAGWVALQAGLPGRGLRGLIRSALREDVGSGDITSRALVDPGRVITAVVVARHACIVCGTDIAAHVFRVLDLSLIHI